MAKNGYEQVQNTPQKPAVISWESLRKLILSAQNESGRIFVLKDTYLEGAERFAYISFKREPDGIKIRTIDTNGTVSTYTYVNFVQELKAAFGERAYESVTFSETQRVEGLKKRQEAPVKPLKLAEPLGSQKDLPSVQEVRDTKEREIKEALEEAVNLPQADSETRKHIANTKHKVLKALSSNPLTRNSYKVINDVVYSTSYVDKQPIPTTTIVLSGDTQDKKTAFLGRVVVETIRREKQATQAKNAGRRVIIFWKETLSIKTREAISEVLVPVDEFYLQDEFIVEPEEVAPKNSVSKKRSRKTTINKDRKLHALDIPEVREIFEQQKRRREEERRAGISNRQFEQDDGARLLIMTAKKHVGKYWASQSAKMLNELGFVTRNGNEIKSLTLNQWLNRKTPKNLVKKQPLTPVYAPPRPPQLSTKEKAHAARMQQNRTQGRIDAVRDREIKNIRAADAVKGKENKKRLESTMSTFESIVKDAVLIIKEGKVDEKKYTYKRPIRRIELSTESVKVPGNKFVMVPTITILVGPLTEESIAHRAAREMCEHLEREKNFLEDPQNPAGAARVVINWAGRFYRQENIFMRGLGDGGFPILERYIQIPGLKNETITIPQGTY